MLSDKETVILATKSMRFTVKEALKYLESQNYYMSESKYHRILKKISSRSKEIAYDIARNFLPDHVNMVNEMINIKKMMYQDYDKEPDFFKRVAILAKITEQNTYISGYSEDTKQIIEEVQRKIGNEEKTNSLSTSSS